MLEYRSILECWLCVDRTLLFTRDSLESMEVVVGKEMVGGGYAEMEKRGGKMSFLSLKEKERGTSKEGKKKKKRGKMVKMRYTGGRRKKKKNRRERR